LSRAIDFTESRIKRGRERREERGERQREIERENKVQGPGISFQHTLPVAHFSQLGLTT
jgi:hypothetical protein